MFSDGFSTHIQFGIPTSPTEPASGSGTSPIVIAERFIAATAC